MALLTCPDPGGWSGSQVEIGTALAGQGMTAYENARLFAQVERLTTTDGLTGLYNRRHFFELALRELALRELALSRRRAGPLTAVMLDIDHSNRSTIGTATRSATGRSTPTPARCRSP